MTAIIVFLLSLYLVFTVVVGLIAKRADTGTIASYFLADGKVSWLHLALTIFATWFSTFAFLGVPGFFYKNGVSWFLTVGAFNLFAPLLAWFIGRKIWYLGKTKKYLTPADLLADIYQSEKVRTMTAFISILALIPYCLIQFVGIGKVLSVATQGVISYEMAIVITMAATALYIFWGGIRAIVLTDLLQGALFLSVIVVSSYIVISNTGGVEAGFAKTASLKPELFQMDANTIGSPLTLVLIWGCGFMVLPHLWQRYYMAESALSLVKGTVVFSFLSLTLVLATMLTGFLAVGLLPGILDTDTLVPTLFREYLSWAVPLIVLATFAAGMSTIDSQVLTAASIVIVDLLRPLSRNRVSPQSEARLSKLISLGLILFLGLLALFPASHAMLVPLASKGTAVALLLFVPLVCALNFPVVRSRAIESSLFLGAFLLFVLEMKILPLDFPYGFSAPAFVFLLQLGICFAPALFSTILSRKKKSHLEETNVSKVQLSLAKI